MRNVSEKVEENFEWQFLDKVPFSEGLVLSVIFQMTGALANTALSLYQFLAVTH